MMTMIGASASDYNDEVAKSKDGLSMMGVTVSPGLETQTLLSSIYPLTSVREVGTDKFMMAYCVNLGRLSIQAHTTARIVTKEKSLMVNVSSNQGGRNDGSEKVDDGYSSGGSRGALFGDNGGADEEYIVEAFLENSDKIEVLVRTLLALELWRENVLFGRGNRHDDGDAGNDAEVVVDGDEHREENSLVKVDRGVKDCKTGVAISSISSEEHGELAFRLAANGNGLRTAFILHVETTIVSLLNLIFYRGVPPELISSKDESAGKSGGCRGDDVLLSLIDYCARQLIFLGTPEDHNSAISRQKNPLTASKLSDHLQNRARIDEILDSKYETMYRTAITSVSLSRYISESSNELGPSLLSRLLEVHDFPMLMVPLIEEPPWTRRRLSASHNAKNNSSSTETSSTKLVWEKLDENNDWKEVPSTDLLRLTKLEGQPWLAIFHLTTSKACRESYGLDEYRKSQLMRLRKYIHETLIDQLPVLADVARYLDELCILGVPPSGQGGVHRSSNGNWSGMLLQRVDLVRDSIMGKKGNHCTKNDEYWETIAQMQWDEVFSHVSDSTDVTLRRIASEVYGGGEDLFDSSTESTPALDTMKQNTQSSLEDHDLVDKVVLHMMEDSGQVTYELAPVRENTPTTTITPMGTFHRIKLSISQTVGECEVIFPRAKIVANVQFQKDTLSHHPREVTLSIDSLSLPTMQHDASQDDYDEVGIELPTETFTSKEWRQIGNVETESVVIQLGFKQLARGMVPAGTKLLRGYTLSQAFISIRSAST